MAKVAKVVIGGSGWQNGGKPPSIDRSSANMRRVQILFDVLGCPEGALSTHTTHVAIRAVDLTLTSPLFCLESSTIASATPGAPQNTYPFCATTSCG